MATKGKTAADVWKSKQWYSVHAPQIFEGKEIAQVVSSDEKNLPNRVVRVALSDLTGDMSHAYTHVDFRIADIKGRTANTKLIGHELSRSYLRTLVRRRRHVVEAVADVTSKDGIAVRVKLSIFVATKVSTPVRTAIRNAVHAEALGQAKEMDYGQLAQEIIFGKYSSRIFNRIKKIAPIRRVEVRKSELKEVFT